MRRLVLAVSLGVALGTNVAAPAATRHATLRVADRSPLVLVGDAFRPDERVLVTVTTPLGPKRARVVAVDGRFRVRFLRVDASGCGAGYAARVVGDRGSSAWLVLGKTPVCVRPPR